MSRVVGIDLGTSTSEIACIVDTQIIQYYEIFPRSLYIA